MAGALLALLIRSDDFVPSKVLKRAWDSLFLAAPLCISDGSPSVPDGLCSPLPLSRPRRCRSLRFWMFSERKWLQKVMTNRFLIYTGTISYGLYLLHKIPFGMVQKSFIWTAIPTCRCPLLSLRASPSQRFPGIYSKSHSSIKNGSSNLSRYAETASKCRLRMFNPEYAYNCSRHGEDWSREPPVLGNERARRH